MTFALWYIIIMLELFITKNAVSTILMSKNYSQYYLHLIVLFHVANDDLEMHSNIIESVAVANDNKQFVNTQ